jgi:predicted nucleotidyltransferase
MSDLRALVGHYNLVAVYAFGSRAPEIAARVRGDSGKETTVVRLDSDVDIGVLPGRGCALSAHDKVCLALALEDVLDVPRVDLVLLSDADPFLAANIVRGERLYAQDAYKADEYDLYVLRRAGDLAPLERERMALILGEER